MRARIRLAVLVFFVLPLATQANLMAKPTRIISLNLGSQTIGLAEFHTQPQGGLVLQNYRLREVLIDPAGEEIRRPQISAALREMMAELQIHHEAVNYAVSAQSVFAHFVKLPAVEEEKIERIIAFEAQQNVPFPIDEVLWESDPTFSVG
jgi:Tfp pilus assembly PilM family ATPase